MRIEFYRNGKILNRLVEFLFINMGNAARMAGIGVFWVKLDCLGIIGNCIVV